MLVGEAPGANEDKQGIPFIGDAGKVLDAVLNEAGLTRERCYITNVAKCRPPQNRTPSSDEAATCLRYLLEEIEQVRPKVILCLGAAALGAMIGKTGTIQGARGRMLTPRKHVMIGDSKLLATYHPASILYDRSHRSDLVQDLKLVKSIVDPAANPDHEAHLVDPESTDDGITPVEELLRDLAQAPVLACDLEWTAAYKDSMTWPWSNAGEVYSLSLTGRVGGRAMSVAFGWPLDPGVRPQVESLMQKRPVVFHNAMADLMWMEHVRLPVQLGGDTMILSYLLDETSNNKLEAVATHYAPDLQGGWKGHIRSTRPQTREEWDELLTYNADDTYATLRAFEGIKVALAKLDEKRRKQILLLHSRLLLPSVPVLMRAAFVGVPIDEPQLAIELAAAKRRMLDAGERLAAATATTPVQAIKMANSSDRTKAYLSGALGIEMGSTRKDNLSAIIDRYPTVKMILEVRAEHKMVNSFLGPWTTMLQRQRDGRLHTLYKPTGTRTGRLSAESEMGGTLQVTPRARWVRRLLRAADGRKLVSADYATVELRITAWRAPEPTMTRLFQEGIDIHKATAAYIKRQARGPVPLGEFMARIQEHVAGVTKDERQAAKGVNFGLVFGMEAAHLADYARINYGVRMTPEEAQQAHRGYFQFYSALKPWQQREMDDAARLGYSETVWGRRRSFDPNDVHAAINTPIQSTASDFGLLAMIKVAELYRQEHIDAEVIGFVHDSILVDVAEDQAELAAKMLQDTMENLDTSPWGFVCPIPLLAETKIGQTWDG